MNTGNVTGSGATSAYYQNLQSKRSGGKPSGGAGAAGGSDAYTAGANAHKGGGIYSMNPSQLSKLRGIADAHFASMRGAVESLIGGMSGPQGQAFWATAANGGAENSKVDQITQDKAKELIGEDGYFGVKRTSERIVEFAKALAGDGADEKTIERLRKGAQAGFDSVARLFGGFDKLPDVTKETYDAVMKSFDDWVSGLKTAQS